MNVQNAMITAIMTTALVSGAAYADDINTVIDASAIAGKSTVSVAGPQTNIESNLRAAGYFQAAPSNNVVVVPRTTIQSNIEAGRES